jgi:putative lipoic acid-binding regulatory protein
VGGALLRRLNIAMEDHEPPRIEFPCDYPVKVLGRNTAAFRPAVISVFERHAPGFDQQTIAVRDSRRGTFVAVTVTITATGPEQLRALHRDLMATGLVQMVL